MSTKGKDQLTAMQEDHKPPLLKRAGSEKKCVYQSESELPSSLKQFKAKLNVKSISGSKTKSQDINEHLNQETPTHSKEQV